MTDVATRRLHVQRLTGEPFAAALDVVGWLGAVQSQDYAGAKWAIGQRTRDATEAGLDRLFDEGAILRTHVLRPTWHFVLPDDLRWLLDLTAPRVKATLAHYDRQLEVDSELLRHSHAVLESALRGQNDLTRPELMTRFERAGIPAAGQRLGHLLMHAELDGLVVSGPRRGKQHTYALLEERAPSSRRLDRDEALAELTRRYFTGHGPAQVADFAWWSGLSLTEVKRGLALAGSTLLHEEIDGKTYWCGTDGAVVDRSAPLVHLLPNYDEFLVAFRDRSASLTGAPGFDLASLPNGNVLFSHTVVLNGQVWGGWKRRVAGRQVVVEVGPLGPLDESERAALGQAADRLGRFLGAPVTLTGK